MSKKYKSVINIDESVNFPNGFTLSDNRIEDYLQKFLKPSEYCVWRQYLRYWGGDKSFAYPSLAKISKSTGLSEKTIRTANKELVTKGFLKYRSGCSNRCNQYYYVPIDELMQKYYGADVPEDKPKEIPPVSQYDEVWDKKDYRNRFGKLTEVQRLVFCTFTLLYKEKMGMEYIPSKNDVKAIAEFKVEESKDALRECEELIKTLFYTRNKYIESSDYTIYFFTRPKTQQILISEFNQTDEGRWKSQAEDHWKNIKDDLPKLNSDKEIEEFIITRLGRHLSGASKARDLFVLNYLIKKVKTIQ